jgi:hypothetical protein
VCAESFSGVASDAPSERWIAPEFVSAICYLQSAIAVRRFFFFLNQLRTI